MKSLVKFWFITAHYKFSFLMKVGVNDNIFLWNFLISFDSEKYFSVNEYCGIH